MSPWNRHNQARGPSWRRLPVRKEKIFYKQYVMIDELQKTILNDLDEHVIVHDGHLRVLWSNRAMQRQLGLTPEAIDGQYCYEVWAKSPHPCPGCPVLTAQKNGRPQQKKIVLPSGAQWKIKGIPVFQDREIRYSIEIASRIRPKSSCLTANDQQTYDSESLAAFLSLKPMNASDINDVKVLEAQKTFLNTLIEAISNPIFYKDQYGRYLGCNRAFEEFVGVERADIIGKTVYDLGPAEIADMYYQKDQELFENSVNQHYEWRVKDARGKIKEVIFDKAVMRNAKGEVIGIVGVISDITERKQFERALKESETTLKAILTASPVGICLIRGRVLAWANPSMYRMVEYELGTMLGKSAQILYKDRDEYEYVSKAFYRVIEEEGIGHIETQWITKRGRKVYCSLKGCMIDPEDPGKGVIVVAMDISKRIEGEKKLIHYQQQLQALAHKLSLAEELERKRLATDLHDSIGQLLALAKLKLGSFKTTNAFAADPDLDAAYELIDKTIFQVRSLTFELSPPELYFIGLDSALKSLMERLKRQHGLVTQFTQKGVSKDLKEDLRVLIFRTIQEILINTVKHANTFEVHLIIDHHKDAVQVDIEDFGVGFDASFLASDEAKVKGYGLFNIKERLKYLGGQFKILSQKGQGTKIALRFPKKAV